jgi:hypothetical protein
MLLGVGRRIGEFVRAVSQRSERTVLLVCAIALVSAGPRRIQGILAPQRSKERFIVCGEIIPIAAHVVKVTIGQFIKRCFSGLTVGRPAPRASTVGFEGGRSRHSVDGGAKSAQFERVWQGRMAAKFVWQPHCAVAGRENDRQSARRDELRHRRDQICRRCLRQARRGRRRPNWRTL